MGLALGTPLLGTRQQATSLRATPWSRSGAFLPGVRSPVCAQVHQYDVAPIPRVIHEDCLGFT
jgi:hypothetical protein